jgi:hypothetical protein
LLAERGAAHIQDLLLHISHPTKAPPIEFDGTKFTGLTTLRVTERFDYDVGPDSFYKALAKLVREAPNLKHLFIEKHLVELLDSLPTKNLTTISLSGYIAGSLEKIEECSSLKRLLRHGEGEFLDTTISLENLDELEEVEDSFVSYLRSLFTFVERIECMVEVCPKLRRIWNIDLDTFRMEKSELEDAFSDPDVSDEVKAILKHSTYNCSITEFQSCSLSFRPVLNEETGETRQEILFVPCERYPVN